jgi:hypothetical protein
VVFGSASALWRADAARLRRRFEAVATASVTLKRLFEGDFRG